MSRPFPFLVAEGITMKVMYCSLIAYVASVGLLPVGCVWMEGMDLIVKYANPKTMLALEEFVHMR